MSVTYPRRAGARTNPLPGIHTVRHDNPKVLKWVATGEEVQVVKEGKAIAVISPAPRP